MDQNRMSGTPPYGSTPAAGRSASTTERVKDAASEAVDSARDVTHEVTSRAAEQARSLFDDQKGRATSQLGALSSALHQTANELGLQQQPIASVVHRAADRLDDLRQGLDSRDLDQIVHETESLARRNPAVFLGGAVAIGFIAARFLKSSSRGTGFGSNRSFEPEERFRSTRSPFVTYGEEI